MAVIPGASEISTIVEANTQEEITKMIGSTPAVLMFMADWCGPCKMMISRMLDEKNGNLRELSQNGIGLYYVDADAHQALAELYGVRALPTFTGLNKGASHYGEEIVGMKKVGNLVDTIKSWYP